MLTAKSPPGVLLPHSGYTCHRKPQSLAELGAQVAATRCGNREFAGAGSTHFAVVQIGAESQERFMTWAATAVLPTLGAS
jgi:hypothetical protein